MKKRLISVASFVLVFAILSSLALSASAEEIYLGTKEDITGYIAPDDQKETRSFGGNIMEDHIPVDGLPVIFSIVAGNVSNLLTSAQGNKSFTKASLPSYARRIVCEIDLNHSLIDSAKYSLNEAIVAGVCYYGYSAQYKGYVYIPVHASYIPYELIDVKYQTDFLIDEKLDSGVTYYSYVKNRYPSGYVYGTVTLYYSSTTG